MSAKKYGMFAQDLDTHSPAEASERQQARILHRFHRGCQDHIPGV